MKREQRNSLYELQIANAMKRSSLLVFVLAFAVIGYAILRPSFAAGPVELIEVESATIQGNLMVGSDEAAAGEAYVRFGTVQPHRGLWVWNSTQLIRQAPDKGAGLVAFAQSKSVNTLYIYSQSYLYQDPQSLGDFIQLAADGGIAVELLFGEREWAFEQYHSYAIDLATAAVAFAQSLEGAKPTAIHYDIEPYSLPEWNANRESISNQLLDLFDAINDVKGDLKLVVDYPMAFNTYSIERGGVSKPMYQWVLDAADRGNLMSYRDHAAPTDGIIDHSQPSAEYATEAGRAMVSSVETLCGITPEKVTFCEEGEAAMMQEISSVISYFGGYSGFVGLSIHDAAGYSSLVP